MERRPIPHPKTSRFTPQQKMVLAVVTMLCGVLLAAAVLLATGPAPGTAARGAVLKTATQQEQASIAATQTFTATPRVPPPLPACAAQFHGTWADSTAAFDGSAIQLAVDGDAVRAGFAALRFSEDEHLNQQAADKVQALLDGQPVYLVSESAEIDSAGRTLYYIFAGERFLNMELVKTGLARADVYTEQKACLNLLQQVEQQARADHIGVWKATPAPTATFVPMVTLPPALPSSCDCSARPVCSDFSTQAEAQVCYNACYDYNSKLDDDRDGQACEELP